MMAGAHPPKPSSSSHRKSRWQSSSTTPVSTTATATATATATNSAADKNPSVATDTKQKPSSNSTANKPPTPKPKPSSNRNTKPSPKPSSGPSPKLGPDQSNLPPFPFQDPPPPPSYGFHMLDRRTIILADGSVRSYFALPPEFQEFTPLPHPDFRAPPGLPLDRQFPMSPDFRPNMRPEMHGRDDSHMRNRNQDYWKSLGLDGPRGGVGPGPGPESSMKRKYVDEEREREREREMRDGFERQRQQLLQYGNPNGANPNGGLSSNPQGPGPSGVNRGQDMRAAKYSRIGEGNVGKIKHHEVDQGALKKSFLNFVKLIYENVDQKRKYLHDGKPKPLSCLACLRSSQDFPDMHALMMHTYNSESADLLVDHLGFHKALCILKGWNYLMPPDNSKSYQILSADQATVNREDLILWPPMVIIHNTITGKGREGRMDGLGNRAMDSYLRDLGFIGGKSKALYNKDGHQGITLIKFVADVSGLKEAMRLSDYFEKDNHGRNGWSQAILHSVPPGKDAENNPRLVLVDPQTGERRRIFYGHLATISDMDTVDFETKKKVMVESLREYKAS